MSRGVRIAALVCALAVATTACAKKTPTTTGPSATSSPTAKKINYLACMVTDTGGIDDRSFNASAWKGIQDAEKAQGIQGKYLQSTSQNDYAPNIRAFEQQGCKQIVTVGFLMGDATKAAATAAPTQHFSIVDFAYDPTLPNVYGLTFQTDQAAFLAGYLAAGMTKSGKVGTFGGMNISPVTIYMNGFAAGILYYNKQKGTNVQLLGWNPKKQDGTFTGDFTNQGKGQQTAQAEMQQGADIIFPVAGNVGLGAAAAVQQAGGDNHMMWVDADGCVTAPQYCNLFITSVLKKIDVAVQTSIKTDLAGQFKGGVYVGTLANQGVGLAPYHNFDSQVPATLKSEITQLQQGIISGSISVDPKTYLG